MSAYPYNFFIGIIIKRFYIIMRNAVAPFLWAIPFEFACAAVVIIQSAAFGSYPQIAVSILNGASYNRIAQPFLLVGRVGITGIPFKAIRILKRVPNRNCISIMVLLLVYKGLFPHRQAIRKCGTASLKPWHAISTPMVVLRSMHCTLRENPVR